MKEQEEINLSNISLPYRENATWAYRGKGWIKSCTHRFEYAWADVSGSRVLTFRTSHLIGLPDYHYWELVEIPKPEQSDPPAAMPCSASSFLEAAAKIDDESEELSHRLDVLLRKRGWKNHSKTPGCIWMWEKTMPDGRVILTNRANARSFEEEMCHDEPEQNEI